MEKMRTQSMTKKMQEIEYSIGIFQMKIENSQSSEDINVYTVEIPTKDQNTPEVKKAKQKEVENLMRYKLFKEVDNGGQDIRD